MSVDPHENSFLSTAAFLYLSYITYQQGKLK